jgi:hypothetical protein
VGAPALDPASIRAIAREVAQVLARGDADQLLTASEVATRFKVDRSWVYAHADELGVIRLGDGPRPRLRFDPAVVARHLLARPAGVVVTTPPSQVRGVAPLLPIRSSRRRRTLESK